MLDPSPDYTLSEADANTFCTLLQAQNALGPAQTSPAQAQFWAFFAAVDVLAYPYGPITNTQLKGWTDKPFAALLQTTKTCYGTDAAGLCVLYSYAQFTVCCITDPAWPNEPCGNLGFPNDYAQRGGKWPTWDESKGLTERVAMELVCRRWDRALETAGGAGHLFHRPERGRQQFQ